MKAEEYRLKKMLQVVKKKNLAVTDEIISI